MASTGPKISSRAMVMSRVTAEKTVGPDEEAGVEAVGRLGPAGHQGGALADSLVDVDAHPVPLGGGHQRTEPGLAVEGVARGERLGRRRGQRLHLGQPVPGDQHPGQGAAGLPGVDVALAHAVGHGRGQVGIGEDHVGRLAPQLQRHPLDGGRRPPRRPACRPGWSR